MFYIYSSDGFLSVHNPSLFYVVRKVKELLPLQVVTAWPKTSTETKKWQEAEEWLAIEYELQPCRAKRIEDEYMDGQKYYMTQRNAPRELTFHFADREIAALFRLRFA